MTSWNHRGHRVQPRVEELESRYAPANNPLLQPPVLNSLPGAAATLYLDFNGNTDFNWTAAGFNFGTVDTPPFDRDGNPNTYSAAERSEMIEIWKFVAEDFAPYNMNVTTVDPKIFPVRKATRVAIGGDGAWAGGGLFGISDGIGTFASGAAGAQTRTVFAFSDVTTVPQLVADTVSHEFGHTLGLRHQAVWFAGVIVDPGYAGPGDDTIPIMGNGFPPARSLWWFGQDTVSQTNLVAELNVIGNATNGFGFRKDDAGDTFASAKLLNITAKGANNVFVPGNITKMDDRDVYKISALAGPITMTAHVDQPFNNLDPVIEIFDRSGTLLAKDDPTSVTNYDASVSVTGTYNGFYYVRVSSHGLSANATANFDFGYDVGTYTLIGTMSPFITGVRVNGPLRWTYNPVTGVYSGIVTISAPQNLPGAYSIFVALPSASIHILSPTVTQSGSVVAFHFGSGILANQPTQFVVQLTNPLHLNLGTFYNSIFSTFLYT